MVEIATVLATVGRLVSVARDAGKLEVWEKALDLQGIVQTLTAENIQLIARVRDLEESMKWKGQLRFARNAYWTGEDYKVESGPYCSRCFDVEGKAIRMVYRDSDTVFCSNCKANVRLEGKDESPGLPYTGGSQVSV